MLLEDFYHKNKWSTVHSTEITKVPCVALNIYRLQVFFSPEDTRTCSMHAAGAMEILIDRVYTNTIRLVGIWHSDTMMIYLHTTKQNFTSGMEVRMVQYRYYAIIPPTHGV